MFVSELSSQRVAYAREVITYSEAGRLSCRGVDLGCLSILLLPPHGTELSERPLKMNLPLFRGETVVVEGLLDGIAEVQGENAWDIRFRRMPTSIRAKLVDFVRKRATDEHAIVVPRRTRPTSSLPNVLAATDADAVQPTVDMQPRTPQTGPHRAATGTLLVTAVTPEQIAAAKGEPQR